MNDNTENIASLFLPVFVLIFVLFVIPINFALQYFYSTMAQSRIYIDLTNDDISTEGPTNSSRSMFSQCAITFFRTYAVRNQEGALSQKN